MILRTDAVVLRAMRYGETSRIVTLFTRDYGKIAVLARGARATKSRFGGAVQPLACIEAVLSTKETRTLQTLRETSYTRRFPTLAADLDRLSAGLRMAELVNALTEDEEATPALFDLLVATLDGLDAPGTHPANALLFFELRLAALLGFQPRFTREAVAALPDDGGVLLLGTGEIVDDGAFDAPRRASRAALRAFATAARADGSVVLPMQIASPVSVEASNLADAYLRHHVGDAYPTRSAAVRAALDARG
ncbi:MAG: DNA repair protein RecO [Rhodothermales bacterium]|nr:DNA repair protein RecO [Rhodothermales bacterium]